MKNIFDHDTCMYDACIYPDTHDYDAHMQGLTGSRYPTQPNLFFNYPTRPVPKFENERVAAN